MKQKCFHVKWWMTCFKPGFSKSIKPLMLSSIEEKLSSMDSFSQFEHLKWCGNPEKKKNSLKFIKKITVIIVKNIKSFFIWSQILFEHFHGKARKDLFDHYINDEKINELLDFKSWVNFSASSSSTSLRIGMTNPWKHFWHFTADM